MGRIRAQTQADVLIITAANGEDIAVRAVEDGAVGPWAQPPELVADFGSTIWCRSYRSRRGTPLRVVLCKSFEMGSDAAGQAAARLIDRLQPCCVAMCGTCAGRPGWTSLGDVVVANYVYRYDSGEDVETKGKRRINKITRTYPLKARWKQAAEHFRVDDTAVWLAERPRAGEDQEPFCIRVGPMGTGSYLQRRESIWDELALQQRDILALDMEAATIGLAGHLQDVPFIVVKGVMDFADEGRTSLFRSFAARAAAEVALGFLRQELEPATKSAGDVLITNTLPREGRTNPATLLNALYQVVPFFELSRKRELDELANWCADDAAVGARLFTGPGGAGKTRLFIEFAKRLRESGWAAGFLSDEVSEEDWVLLVESVAPVFIVVDHAEGRRDLQRLLEVLAHRSKDKPPVRLALLGREPSDWWQALLESSKDHVRHILEAKVPLDLFPVPLDGPMRREIYSKALASYGSILRRPEPTEQRLDFAHPRFEKVLYLHMAALSDVQQLGFGAAELLDGIVRHERDFWIEPYRARLSRNDMKRRSFLDAASRSVAAVALRGRVLSKDALIALLNRVDGPKPQSFRKVLRDLYPGQSAARVSRDYLVTLEPDLLADHLILSVLNHPETSPSYLLRVFEDGDPDELTTGFTSLGRISTWQETDAKGWVAQLLGVDVEARALPALRAALALTEQSAFAVLGPVLASALERHAPVHLAPHVDALIPDATVSLREVAVWAIRAMLERRFSDSETDQAERARLLNDLGIRLRDLGRREAALQAAREATALYGRLFKVNDEFLAHWASALDNLAACWSDLRQDDKALKVVEVAVELYRRLEAGEPNRFLDSLAASLSIMAAMQGRSEEYESALRSAGEAVELYHRLVASRGDAFLPGLATSLLNRAISLAHAAQPDRALQSVEQAIDIYRRLAEVRPDAFLPDLARANHNLAIMRADLGQREAALAAAQEAVAQHRRLVGADKAFLPDLASALYILGCSLNQLRQGELAVKAIEESVDIYCGIGERNPPLTPRLAETLTEFLAKVLAMNLTLGLPKIRHDLYLRALTVLHDTDGLTKTRERLERRIVLR